MKLQLLANGATNAKLAKSVTESFIMYLSPYTNNSKGVNLCPFASEGCAAACLNTAGRGAFNNVQEARKRKTEWLLNDRKGFYTQLASEISYLNQKAFRKGEQFAIRLNGTSDIDHLDMIRRYTGIEWNSFGNIIFYDYTKSKKRYLHYFGTAYSLTFSRSEENEKEVTEVLRKGGKVAIVFNGVIPETYKGFKVINGDATDERFKDHGHIVGLSAKGRAKKDVSGFVDSI